MLSFNKQSINPQMSKMPVKFIYSDAHTTDAHPLSVEVHSATKGPLQVNSIYETYLAPKFQDLSIRKDGEQLPWLGESKEAIEKGNKKVHELLTQTKNNPATKAVVNEGQKTKGQHQTEKGYEQKVEQDKKDDEQKKNKYKYINVPVQQQSKDGKYCYCFDPFTKNIKNTYKIQE